jgi:hypothetical protein
MICPTCQGKGIVPASLGQAQTGKHWNGEERRQEPRWTGNDALKFREAEPAARYHSCPRCEGSGKLHPNLLSV